MRFWVAGIFLLFCVPMFAASKTPGDYQDAVLVSFKTVADGSICSSTGTVNANGNDNQKVNSNSTTACSDSNVRLYTVRVADAFYVLRPTIGSKQVATDAAVVIGTLGWGALFIRNREVLANQLPGAHILIRSHGNGFEVKIASKSSLYSLVAAQ